jgi:hypothetical protein
MGKELGEAAAGFIPRNKNGFLLESGLKIRAGKHAE